MSSKTPTLIEFKKNVEKKRKVIQRQKWRENKNLPEEEGMLLFIGDDYQGEIQYGMAKLVKDREPRNAFDYVDYITIWWDGVGWRQVKEEYRFGSTNLWSKYWIPAPSKEDAPVVGKEQSLPKTEESGRFWSWFSRKSKPTST